MELYTIGCANVRGDSLVALGPFPARVCAHRNRQRSVPDRRGSDPPPPKGPADRTSRPRRRLGGFGDDVRRHSIRAQHTTDSVTRATSAMA